jgi:hypothetical protein
MSEQKELEKLQAKRAELEAESRSLKEEQKRMEYSVMILEEKVTIEEISNNNQTAKDAISKLEAKLYDLENRLKSKPQATPESPPPPPPKETKTEVIVSPEKTEEEELEFEEAAPAEPQESEEENVEESGVTVTAIDDEGLAEAQEAKGDKQQEKKKHRFF